MGKIVDTVIANLSDIFRHVVPGVVALGVARMSHPLWLCWFKPVNASHFAGANQIYRAPAAKELPAATNQTPA